MNHADHVRLLQNGVPQPGGVWADFGSGDGAFTLALAELLGPAGEIYSIDRDRGALARQAKAIQGRFGLRQPQLHYRVADYTQKLALPLLDGIVMANALHFQLAKQEIVHTLRSYLRPGGRLLLVEYNVERGNRWVPFPLSFSSWKELAGQSGFVNTRMLARQPSRFLGEFFAAESLKPETGLFSR
ncbi:MAG TPA: class I SAM-dependent methyltransferase [Anaerolineales bacterium]|nr:class I SAM-dependent methyltransferase [Anaerolineales bacterium]